MHIMEGFLPPMWALAWWLLFLPCLWYGFGAPAAYRSGREQSEGAAGPLRGVYFCSFGAEDPVGDRQLLASDRRRSGGDPLRAGRGGGAGAIVLLFRALLLAHGGLTTLGANGMSMAVIGPMVGYLVWKLACRAGIRRDVGVFLCAMLADLMTYFVTSVQLGVAFPDPATGAGGSIAKFMGIFCLTQIPIAIAEGLLTVMIYDQLTKRRLIAAEAH